MMQVTCYSQSGRRGILSYWQLYAYVLSGAIRSQVGDEPARVYRIGEGFYEVPGAHHRISENASDKEPASLLAVFVVDYVILATAG